MRYNLEVLNDKEFEELAKDLLDAKLNLDLEIFKVGKDGGIDLRDSQHIENKYLVQVKHYVNSEFSDLISSLRKEKMKLLAITPKPKHYIIFTSLSLSPQQASKIKELLQPFVTSTNHVYGRRRVENLISKNKEVERKYFKLWLTSTNVLTSILHNATVTNSEFYTEKIIRRAKLYVHTKNIDRAMSKLNENKFLIISGEPGVGKTTLAYMLVYQLLGDGFKLIYSDRSVKDAEHLLSNDPNEKQVILIDDFLGSNLIDLFNTVNTEARIIGFFEKISFSKNKYLIFTSRTMLLNQANHHYENLSRSGASRISNYELKISGYTLFEKACILYNHLYHGHISKDYISAFYSNQNYLKIVKHKNYYPRLIEFITTEQKFKISNYSKEEDFIFDSLTNPDEIWRFAFEKQLSRPEQLLLETLYSFGDGPTNLELVEEAFDHRYQYEILKNNAQRELNGFHSSLKKLSDGFLKMEIDSRNGYRLLRFINPSLGDFFIKYIEENRNEKFNIWSSAKYIEQLTSTFAALFQNDTSVPTGQHKKYFRAFNDNMDNLETTEKGSSLEFKILAFLYELFRPVIPDYPLIISRLLANIVDKQGEIDSWRLCDLLVNIKMDSIKEAISVVNNNWDSLIALIIDNINHSSDLEGLQELFSEYDKDFGDYLENDDSRYDFHSIVTKIFEHRVGEHDFNSEINPEYFDYYSESTIEKRLSETIDQMYWDYLTYANLDDYFDHLEPNYDISVSEIIYEYKSHFSAEDYIYDSEKFAESTERASDNDIEESIHRLFQR